MSETTAVATTDLPLDVLASEIKARIEAGDRAADKAADHFRAAGLRLLDAKKHLAAAKIPFDGWLIENDIGRSRAYELIGIAKGTKTLAGIRASTAARVARHADKNRAAREASVSNGQPEDDTDDDSEVAAPEVVIDNLMHAIGGINENARIFNKFLKASTFDQDAVTKINAAINRMIKKWGSIQSVLGVTTPALSGADVEKLNEKLDAGLRLVEAYSNDSALQAAQAEVDQLIEENEALRDNSLHQDDRANEVTLKLIETYDTKYLTKVHRMLGDHLKHPERTPFQRRAVLMGGMEHANGKRFTVAEIDAVHSWKIEAVDVEGQRWGNGVRLGTEKEARLYAETASKDGYASTEVIRAPGEPALASVSVDDAGDVIVNFIHGMCRRLQWHPLPNVQAA
jgi:hypothetical protein